MYHIYTNLPLNEEEKAVLTDQLPAVGWLDQRDDVQKAEVFFGDSLSAEELERASMLRWVHLAGTDLSRVPLARLRELGTVLITIGTVEEGRQQAEFALTTALSYGKKLIPAHIKREHGVAFWPIKGKKLVQAGLTGCGHQFASLGQALGFRVVGVHYRNRFHECCEKVILDKELHSILPSVDLFSFVFPRCTRYHQFIGKKELSLLPDEAVLVGMEVSDQIDLAALQDEGERFRGIYLEFTEKPKKGLELPNLLTADAARYTSPSSKKKHLLSFLRNMRYFLHGGYSYLQGRIDWDFYLSKS